MIALELEDPRKGQLTSTTTPDSETVSQHKKIPVEAGKLLAELFMIKSKSGLTDAQIFRNWLMEIGDIYFSQAMPIRNVEVVNEDRAEEKDPRFDRAVALFQAEETSETGIRITMSPNGMEVSGSPSTVNTAIEIVDLNKLRAEPEHAVRGIWRRGAIEPERIFEGVSDLIPVNHPLQ